MQGAGHLERHRQHQVAAGGEQAIALGDVQFGFEGSVFPDVGDGESKHLVERDPEEPLQRHEGVVAWGVFPRDAQELSFFDGSKCGCRPHGHRPLRSFGQFHSRRPITRARPLVAKDGRAEAVDESEVAVHRNAGTVGRSRVGEECWQEAVKSADIRTFSTR